MFKMVTMSGLWLLLAACVAAYDSYDEAGMMDFKEDIPYYDDSTEVDSGQFKDNLRRHDVMILFNPMPNVDNEEWRLRYRPVLNIFENRLLGLGWSNPSAVDIFNVVKKRIPAIKATVKGAKVKAAIRRQPRWRIKSPPRLCLLKVCPPYFSYL